MAEKVFTIQATLIEGTILRAGPLLVGDTTNVLTINEGNAEVTVHAHGVSGGATLALQGSLLNDAFDVVDDVYGDAMSYTSLTPGVIRSVGPAVNFLKAVLTGGGGSTEIYVDVYVVRKVR
jgi:hypothetical protein